MPINPPPDSNDLASESPTLETTDNENNSTTETPTSVEPKPSYVKLAMRNMVRKRGKSLTHFFLSTLGILAFLIGISYLTR